MIHDHVTLLNQDVIRVADTARIDSFTKIEGGQGVWIKDWVHIASFCHIIGGGKAMLREHSAMSSHAMLITGSNTLEGVSCSAASPPELQVIKRSFVVLQPFSIVYCNAIVYPGVTIGTGAVVKPGAIVTKDVPAFEVWAGVPAKISKTASNNYTGRRDKDIIDKILRLCYDYGIGV